MAFESGLETLICRHCEARHKVSWERIPVREEQSLSCKACHKPLLTGKGVKEYFDLELSAG